MKKASNIEIKLRVDAVYEMIVKGFSRKHILQYSAEKFKITERQTDEYIKRAHKEIEDDFNDDYRKNLVKKHFAQLDDLYFKNYMIQDFRECRSIIESKSKLIGAYKEDNTQRKVEIVVQFDE